jgi:hypothetical protein
MTATAATRRAVHPMVPPDQMLILFGATGDLRSANCFRACFIWRSRG